MTVERSLTHLSTHREAILAILDGAEAMLTDPQQRDIAGLALARWSLMRELTAYQLFKHAKLLDPVIAQGRAEASRLKQAGVEAVNAFRANVQRWSSTDVAAVWPTYQASALAMIARLREQVRRDREQIAVMVGVITPPPAAAPPRPGRPTPAG